MWFLWNRLTAELGCTCGNVICKVTSSIWKKNYENSGHKTLLCSALLCSITNCGTCSNCTVETYHFTNLIFFTQGTILKITVFLDVTPHYLVAGSQYFGQICHLHFKIEELFTSSAIAVTCSMSVNDGWIVKNEGGKSILVYFKIVLHHFKEGTQENHISHDSWAVGLDFNSGLPKYWSRNTNLKQYSVLFQKVNYFWKFKKRFTCMVILGQKEWQKYDCWEFHNKKRDSRILNF